MTVPPAPIFLPKSHKNAGQVVLSPFFRGAIRALIQLAKNDASVFDTCSTLSLKKLKNAQKRAKKARNSAKRWKKLSNFFSRITAC